MLKKGIAHLVYSNLWISVGSTAMAWMFYQIIEIPLNYYVLSFLFFATLVTYTFQRFIKLYQKESIEGPRIHWMNRHPKTVRIIMVIGLIGACVFGMCLSWKGVLFLSALGTISFLYAYKVNYFSVTSNLRDLPAIKIFLISGVWSASTAILPAIEAEQLSSTTYLVFLGYFLFIIAITIPFDIRDIDVDESSKQTIPQLTGVPFSKLIGVILVILSYFLILGEFRLQLGLTLGALLSIFLILLSNRNRNELYYSFTVDGLLIVIPILYNYLSCPELITN